MIAAAWDAGVPVDNDIGLFFQSFATDDWARFSTAPRVIAVTGSNGKSTTSALIHHIVEENGRPTQLAGNMAGACWISNRLMMVRWSCWNCHPIRQNWPAPLTPDVAVLTNISPDHLDRHAGLGGYFAAKRRLFSEGGPDRCVIGMDDIEGRFLANQLAMGPRDDRVIQVSSGQKLEQAAWSVFARKGFLSEYRKGRQVASIDLRAITGLPGAHNHQNACAAYAACRTLGFSPKGIEAAMQSFGGFAASVAAGGRKRWCAVCERLQGHQC